MYCNVFDIKRKKYMLYYHFIVIQNVDLKKKILVQKDINTSFKKTRKVDLNHRLLKNYKKIPKLTTMKYVTYCNEKENTIVMSIRGTDLTRLEENDILTDALLAFGQENVEIVTKIRIQTY